MHAPKCPRCGLPTSYPGHDGEPCKPLSDRAFKLLIRKQAQIRQQGRETEWREWGAKVW
jgi:hypothetical protein